MCFTFITVIVSQKCDLLIINPRYKELLDGAKIIYVWKFLHCEAGLIHQISAASSVQTASSGQTLELCFACFCVLIFLKFFRTFLEFLVKISSL